MRWYGVLLAMLAAALAFAAHRHQRLRDPDANVPIVSLLGPSEVQLGGHSRFAVLVRDRSGVPLPDAKISVGFERNGFDEVATATTGLGGEAIVEVPTPYIPSDEAWLLRAYADTSIGRGRDDHWIAPRAASPPIVAVATDAPMYAPGETVHVRAVFEGGAADASIRLERSDQLLYAIDEKSSPFGVVAVDLPLAESLVEGAYVVRVSAGERKGRASFQVARRAAPSMNIVLEGFVATTTCEGTVRATWPLGAPIRDGKVSVRLDSATQGIEGPLDAQGRFHFDLSPGTRDWCWGALTARVERRGVSETLTKWIARTYDPEHNVTIYPEGGVLVPGATQTLYARGEKSLRAAGVTAKANERGLAELRLTVPAQDLRVDVDGRREPVILHPDPSALLIHPSQEIFVDEGPASVTVYGANEGERVVLQATKGADVIAVVSGVVKSAAQGVALEVPFRKDLEGLVWLQATSSSRTGRRLMTVSPRAHRLEVSISEAAKSYPLRSTAPFDVSTGRKAELGVSVVERGGERSPALALERSARDFGVTFPRAARDDEDVRALASESAEPRGLLHARLGRHEPPWPIATTEREAVSRLGDTAHERERLRTRAWLTLALAVTALFLFAPFLGLGLDHLTLGRRPHEAMPKEARDRRWMELVRASAAWTAAIVIPPLALLLPRGRALVWTVAAAITIAVVAEMLRRARLSLALAAGLAFAHAACALALLDRGEAVGSLLYIASDRWAIPVLALVLGQLVLAILAVVRITSTEPTTLRDRRVRFFKSALVSGLPVTLGLLGYGAYLHVHAANVSWREFAAKQWSPAVPEPEAASALPPHEPEIVSEKRPERLSWQPRVITDDKGHAHIAIPTGETPRSYVLDVNALDRKGQLGSGAVPLDVASALLVEVPPLRELVEGDEVSVPITMTGYGDVTLTVTGLAAATRHAKLDVHAPYTEIVTFRAAHAGEQVLRVEADDSVHHEVIERKIRVVPNLDRVVVVENGMETANRGDLHVEVYGSRSARNVEERVEGSFDFVSSLIVPSLVRTDQARLMRVVPKLLSFEVRGGGFSSTGAPPASPERSAHALMLLTELAKVLTIDPEVAKRTRAYLKSLSSDDLTVLWALAAEPESASKLDRLEARRPSLAVPELALGANAMVAAGRDAEAWLDALAESDVYGAETQALAAHAFARAGKHPKLAAKYRAEIAKERSWSAMMWRALLDVPDAAPANEVSVVVDRTVIETFPRLAPDAHRRVDVHATSDVPHFIEVRGAADAMIVAEGWAPIAGRPTHMIPLPTEWLDVTYPARASLGAVCPAKVSIRWMSSATLRNVVVEIPIPAGLTLDAHESPYLLRIDEPGSHEIEIPFVAAYAGTFAVRPSHMPHARSESGTLRIE